MAKRSDFAQKLLDDLRLRKEKMGMAPSGQRSAHAPSAGNANGNSRWSFRGSGEATSSKSALMQSSKNMPNTEVTKMWLSTRHHRTPSLEVASQDITPVGRTRSKEHSIDVSMALALALSNSGKLQNIELFSNATVGKKKLILHCGSQSFRETDSITLRPSTDQFPSLSQLQIGEISKGVQKLNMILKACSNGLNFSRNSIDIGRELLKGAMDLEESLRMLVSLQDASDYMVGSQGKQVRLPKEKEKESSDEVNNWKLTNRPKFSFDGSSRHSKKLVKEGSNADFLEQKQMALSYPEKLKAPKSNYDEISSKASLQFNSHRRSLSCSPGSKPDAQSLGHASEISHSGELKSFSEEGNSSTSTSIKRFVPKGSSVCEKVRIPNVVAKLMGLEELPLPMAEMNKSEVQKVSKPKQVKKIGKTMTPDVEISKKEADEMTYSASKTKGQNNVPQEKSIVENKAKNNLEAVHSRGMKNLKDLDNPENMNAASDYSPKPHCKISKQMDMTNINRRKEILVAKVEAAETREKTFIRQQICKGNVEQSAVEKPILEHDAQYTTSLPPECCDNIVREHELTRRKKDMVPKEQRNAQLNPNGPQQQSAVHRLKPKQAVHESAAETESNAKNKLHSIVAKKREVNLKNKDISSYEMRTQNVSSSTSTTLASKRSSTNTTDTEQPKIYLKGSHHEKQNLKNRSSAYHELDKITENGNSEERRPLKSVAKTDNAKTMPLTLVPAIRKPVHNQSAQMVEVTKVRAYRNENSRILVEEPRRTETTDAKGQNSKQQTSFLHELEHRWKERTSRAGVIDSSHAMNSKHHSQQKIAPTTPSCNPLTDDCKKPRPIDQSIAADANVASKQRSDANPMQSHDTNLTASAAQQPPEMSLKEGLELQSILKENQSEGPVDSRQLRQGLLTKNEHALIQILTNSQHFLNTAQTLFKIKIPLGVLQATENVCQDEGSKLVLDCGYELMRRKGKREEVVFAKKMSFVPSKVRWLEALIKELNDDLESLEFPRKIENDDYDTAECLHKMIERDVHNRNPDVNCMWDFGWNSMIFANTEKDEIIRDVEKHVLNGLINHLARDLINVSINNL